AAGGRAADHPAARARPRLATPPAGAGAVDDGVRHGPGAGPNLVAVAALVGAVGCVRRPRRAVVAPGCRDVPQPGPRPHRALPRRRLGDHPAGAHRAGAGRDHRLGGAAELFPAPPRAGHPGGDHRRRARARRGGGPAPGDGHRAGGRRDAGTARPVRRGSTVAAATPPRRLGRLVGVDNLSAIYDRATFLFEAKRYAEAADLFAQLAEAEPNYHEVQLYLARAYYYSAQLGRAEQTLRAIVERWPSDAYAYFVLARTLQR